MLSLPLFTYLESIVCCPYSEAISYILKTKMVMLKFSELLGKTK